MVNAAGMPIGDVSTHSHPKVAAVKQTRNYIFKFCFNTQPPEGGCVSFVVLSLV